MKYKELARRAAVRNLDAQIDRDKDIQLQHFVNTGEVLPPKKYVLTFMVLHCQKAVRTG
jgi:hypothetical protein